MRHKVLILGFVMAMTLCAAAQTPDQLYDEAVNNYILNSNSKAVSLLNQVLALDPLNNKAKALLEEIKKDMGDQPDQILPYQPAKKKPALSRVPLIQIKVVPSKKSDIKTRIDAKNIENQLKRDLARKYYLQGKEYLKAGDFKQAKALFQNIFDILPGSIESRANMDEMSIYLTNLSRESQAGQPLAENLKKATWWDYFLLAVLVILTIMLFYRIFRGNPVKCGECGTRNPKDSEFCKKCGTRLKIPLLTDDQKVWFSKFGWHKNPFMLTIIPDTFTGHKEEISTVLDKLNTLSGHILLIGGLGTGKSTLLQWLEKHLKDKFETIYVLRPPARSDELIDLVSATITKKTTSTKKYSVYDFQNICKNYKRNILLLLDEAHEFKEEFEQFLRTLGDLPNVFLVLAGLPQAREKLKRDLPALFDRVVETILIGSLTLEETRELINKRIANAGGKGLGPFAPLSVEKIFDLSFGIPRGILKICDWAITQAVHANKFYIDVDDIAAYGKQIEIGRSTGAEK